MTTSGAPREPPSTPRGSTWRTFATVDRPTGVALIVVDEHAENLIAVAPGANASRRPRP